ncbi:MAG: peptidase M42, partial [Firmicutes bacterium]|nr:peptidase M42 [Bacillota bacterium]
MKYMDYILDTMKKLLAIPSPSGFTREAAEFVMAELEAMGYEPQMTLKRGVVCDLGGEKADDGILLAAH